VALSGHLAFVAAGAAGLRTLDVTDPTQPVELDEHPTGASLINQAHGVAVGAVPTQTWVFVADGTNGVRAVNVSALFDPYRGRSGAAPSSLAAAHLPLTLEARDPLAPRDTSRGGVDEIPMLTFATRGSARAIARGAQLDRIADESGRRLRDSWNPGTAVLQRSKMDAMRAVVVPFGK
jgi:hypothetical protein